MSIRAGITLFTSDRRPRYAADVLNVLALPEGSTYHFRYAATYVLPELRNEFENLSPRGTRALIVFRDEVGEESSAPYMVPLRWATITSIDAVSDFYVIRFKVQGYPHTSQRYSGSKSEISRLCSEYLAQFSEPTRGLPVQLGLTPFVEPRTTDERATWVDIARRLAEHPTFAMCHFLRVSNLASERGRALPVSGQGEFRLPQSQYAVLRVDYYALNSGTFTSELSFESDSALLRIASLGSIPLDSRYDSRDIWVQGGSVAGRTATELQIATRSGVEDVPQTAIRLRFLVEKSRALVAYQLLTMSVGAWLVATPGLLGDETSVAHKIVVALAGGVVLALGAHAGAGR